jgi:hypothetical protein
LCHTNSAMVTQVVARPLNVRNDDSNLTIRTPCFSRFIGRSNRLWRKSLYQLHPLEYRINSEIYTSYTGAAVMLPRDIDDISNYLVGWYPTFLMSIIFE